MYPFPALAGGVKHLGFQRHAHIAADLFRRPIPAGKGRNKARLLPVVVVAKGVADLADDGLVQGLDFHAWLPPPLVRTATAQGMRPGQRV